MIEAAAAVQHWLANTATSIGAGGFALVLVGSVLAMAAAGITRRLLNRTRAEDDVATEAPVRPRR